ncbi:MAG: hypothetical protein ACRCWC_08260 [Plesiomonas shigelloides]
MDQQNGKKQTFAYDAAAIFVSIKNKIGVFTLLKLKKKSATSLNVAPCAKVKFA